MELAVMLIATTKRSGIILNYKSTNKMIEKVLDPRNLERALRQVMVNKGSAGIDGMRTDQLVNHLETQRERLLTDIKGDIYLPQAILGVEIPKGGGKTRLLGVPTVVDRLLQQAVSQVIMYRFEKEFSESSYGFRPRRSARQAVQKSKEYIEMGFNYIIDMDLKTFFDEVDHCLVLNLIYRKVKCPITMRLIRKWLRAPIMLKGQLTKRTKGVPQGSPISPLLSNILLHELDKELERQGLKFVRYADDFSIYVNSKAEAKTIGNKIYKYLRDKLKLTINREKSGIRRPVHFEILGFRFASTYTKGDKGKYQLTVGDKPWERLQQSLKSITRKTSPISLAERIAKINEIQLGWLNYFRGASIYSKLKTMDGWLRNRLRYCIWHDWKKPERKRKNLIRLGVNQGEAYAWSRTRKGGWAVAQSPILGTTITLERLRKRGYLSLLDVYIKLNQ
jgi:RNA-directed DNA polymerase